ncbi:PP2C family protein-serine/threonine phosphatase [[Kitasatospora] papulosa]|uniref:PP2C family protein-serine/threonine phosphatase n=1 Tax=[Kitasatospora] papulosa TaxID=1464011 RepID=UPI0036B9BBB6
MEPPLRTYATAQLTGTRDHQCDAIAVFTDGRLGTRAYVLLDGVGDNERVRQWARAAARRLARTAARRGDAETGLRAVYSAYAVENGGYGPKAAAVVAVATPGKPLTVAWSGDSRAYLVLDGMVQRLTRDHNVRRVFGGSRHRITSCLGAKETDAEVRNYWGHDAIESATHPAGDVRLLLASDGAYEPHEDAWRKLASLLGGTPREAARRFATTAVDEALAAEGRSQRPGSSLHADNATVLVADLTG